MIFSFSAMAQDRTTVTATSDDISDNLDLRAVASLFGDAANLEEFERLLNDPKSKISNLDLNRDNQVDYLRVVESVEGGTHLILIQAVLERDVFQDVATVEVERDRNNNVQVQVVGDTYMYGSNYIYEPVYVYTPAIYNTFWVRHYRPYWSTWYWGYYPSWYYAWTPVPYYSYCNNVALYVNNNHYYHYASGRRSSRAAAMHSGIRANGYRTHYEGRSFAQRVNFSNRREMDQVRIAQGTRTSTPGTRTTVAPVRTSTRTAQPASIVDQASTSEAVPVTGIRSTRSLSPATTSGVRASAPRTGQPVRTRAVTVETPVRGEVRSSAPVTSRPRTAAPRTNYEAPAPRTAAPAYQPGTRQQAPTRTERRAAPDFQTRAPQMRSTPIERGNFTPQRQATGATRQAR